MSINSINGKARGAPVLGGTPAAVGGDGAEQTATPEAVDRQAAGSSAEPQYLTKPRNHGKWVWMKRDHLAAVAQTGGDALLVYMTLRDHDRTAGERSVFLTTDTLMSETGLSRNTVLKSISKLEAAGLLEVTRATAKCNRYKFPSTVRPAHRSIDTNSAPGAPYSAPGAPQRCARRTVNGAPGALEREEERREEKRTDLLAPKLPRARNELFDAIAEIGGADPSKDGKRIGKVCRELHEADPPYTAEDVRALPAAIAAAGMGFTLTVEAIGKYISWVRHRPTTVAKPARRTGADLFNEQLRKKVVPVAKPPTPAPAPEELEQRRQEAADRAQADQDREEKDRHGVKRQLDKLMGRA
jgi:hypothetical protein